MSSISYIIDFKSLEQFWNWLRYGYPKDAYTEIILMCIKEPILYDHVKQFSKQHTNIIVKKNCQFFIQNFEDLKFILTYKDNIFIKHSKICYSISPRFTDAEDISGGYKYMNIADFIFLDIEKIEHTPLSTSDEEYLNIYVEHIVEYLKKYNLTKPVIIHSGNGCHVLYKIKPKKFNEKRKAGYREFIVKLEGECNSKLLKIDHMVNLSRCIALPFTFNHKANKMVEIVSKIPENPINDFYIKNGKKKKKSVILSPLKKGKIEDSLAWNILIRDCPQGSRHSILIFSLKLLLKAFNIREFSEYEETIQSMYGGKVDLDFEKGCEGKTYNKGILVNWCKRNIDWCKKYFPNWQDKAYI